MTNQGRGKFSQEARLNAVKMVLAQPEGSASQWATIRAVASKIGCSAETLRGWVRKAEREGRLGTGQATYDRERLQALERENRRLRQANKILHEANDFFPEATKAHRLKL